MYTMNKYLFLKVSKKMCNSFKRRSSHFVYHPEQISNKQGKNYNFLKFVLFSLFNFNYIL